MMFTIPKRTERIIKIAVGMLSLSIFLMILVIPAVYTRTIPNDTNPAAALAVSFAILFRFLIIIWLYRAMRIIRRQGKGRKSRYTLIGFLLILLALVYLSGAFSYSNNKDILYVSYLMFASVFCDLIASILTFTLSYAKFREIH